MRLRNPLIALAVLVGLVAYVYFIEIRGGEEKKKAREASEKALPFEPEKTTEVRLTQGGSEVHLAKVAGSWKILEPVTTAPESEAVERLLHSLADLRISHDLGKPSDLKLYNLLSPPLKGEIETTASKSGLAFSLGDDVPTGGGTYARFGDAGKVLVVTGAQPVQSASLFSLRDKTFFRFDPARLASCRIIRGKEEMTLSRIGGKWRFTSPVLAPSDDSSVSDLVYALERLSVTEFVEEKPIPSSLANRGLNPPQIRVVLTGEEWQGEKALSFGNGANGSLFALRPAGGELVRVGNAVESKLKGTVASLRKKDVLPFPRFEIARLRITGLTPESLQLERRGDTEWLMIGRSSGVLGDEPVDLLLRNLTDLRVATFVDRPEKKLAGLGLSKPAIRLEFWDKVKEKGQPAVLEVGREDGKGKIAMKDTAWPSVMMVEASLWKKVSEQVTKVTHEKVKPGPNPVQASPTPAPASPGTESSTR